jgi:hypothetical protein
MAFSPEHFIRPATDPVEWAKLQSESMARLGQTVGNLRREEEQKRQFEMQQAEIQRQHDLVAGQQRAQLQFDRQKHAADLQKMYVERDIEGMKLIREAHVKAEGVDDFNVNADKISRSYDIMMTPMGEVPPEMARGVATGTAAVPDPDAPPGTAPALGAMPGPTQPAPAEGAAAPAEPGLNTEGAVGAAQALEAAGMPPPATVTTGASAVAETAMAAQADMLQKTPLDPNDAATATEAQKADEENPVVAPFQEAPTENPHEAAIKRLRKQKPVIAVEMESRASTDAQIAADMERRAKVIRDARLSPVAEAVALNMARGALGLPQIPVPPASVPDPNTPVEAQGSGEWEVLIPPEIEALAKQPPQLKPDVVRDAMRTGGWDYWSMSTGRYLGSDDWEATQESRIEWRRQAYATLSSMGTNAKEVAQIEATVEAAVRSGSDKPIDILEAMLRMQGQKASAGLRDEANDRANRAENRAVLAQVEEQTTKLITEQRTIAQLETMHTNLQIAGRSIEALRGESGDRTSQSALKQRGVIAERLKTLMGARATDKDARLALDTTFRKKVEEWMSYVGGDGTLPDKYMKELEGVFQELEDDELEKAYKTAGRLYRVIVQNLTVNQLPNVADYQAREALGRQFPELTQEVIDEIALEAQKEPRRPPPLAPDWSMSESQSSSRSKSGGGSRKTRKPMSDDELDDLIGGP